MRYLKHSNHIFKQSAVREDEFFAINDPNLFIILTKTGKVWGSENMGYCDYTAVLYKDNLANVIERNLFFIEEELSTDPRDLITESNIDNWVMGIRQENTGDSWYFRDICLVEQWCDDLNYRNVYFSINLSNTVLGENFDDAYSIDIYEFSDYVLYYKCIDGSYHLVDDIVTSESYDIDDARNILN